MHPIKRLFGAAFSYFDLYLTQLKEQGYAVGSLYEQIHILKTCDCWLKRTGRTCAIWMNPWRGNVCGA